MTHLNIQQGLNIEVVSTNLIKKLYEAALSVPEPLEGELDAAYMSGNLLVSKSYRALVEYLTNRFDDLHINVTDSYYIPFEDSAILNALLANNIGDGIGVTEAEAANATFTSSTFLGNTDITSFNTFKYFTKANTNPPSHLFYNCTNLTSIDLSNVTTCSGNEFRNSGLSGEISLPNLTGNVPRWSFAGTNITNVTNLGTVTGISSDAGGGGYLDGAFSGCTNLVSVTVPSTVTAISGAFLGCNKLTTINGDLTNVITLGNSSFSNTKISSLPNTPNVLTIGNTCFSSCTLMTGVLNYPNLTSIGYEAFKGTAITSILDLGNITSILGSCFNGCTSLTTVNLPQSCIELRGLSFRNCTMLSSINLGNVSRIDSECFRNTPNLTTLDLSSLSSLGGSNFLESKYYTITLPLEYYTLTSASNAFGGDSILKTITNVDAVENWSKITFDMPRINTGTDEIILNFKNATEVYSAYSGANHEDGLCNHNYDIYKIKALYAPKLTETITAFNGTYNRINPAFGVAALAYRNSKARRRIQLLYFKNINNLSINAFGGLVCQALVINNTTPPTVTSQHYDTISEYLSGVTDVYCDSWGNLSLLNGTTNYLYVTEYGYYENTGKLVTYHNITAIYVPDSAVTAYQNATGWSSVSNLITPISNLNSGVIYTNEQDWVTAGKPVGLIADYLGLNTADLATFVSANNLTYYVAPSS